MRELLILLAIVAAIAIIWYVWQVATRIVGRQRLIDDSRPIGPDAAGSDRASMANSVTAPGTAAAAAEPAAAAKGAGLFQDAATSAAGLPYERAADEMERMTADLATARRDAERTAERLANRAAEALAAIQAAAAAHGGAVPGDGTERCPSNYPVKATMAEMRYHIPGAPTYDRTIPDICLLSATAAEAAGFSESARESGASPGAVAVEDGAAK